MVATRPRMALALLLVLTFGAIAPPTLATFRSKATAGNEQAIAEAITSRNPVGAAEQSAAGGSAAAGPDEAAGADGDTGGDEADAHLRRRLLSLHGVLLPHLQRGDARARRVMELLASVGALGAELRAAGDSWAAGRADVLSAASGRVRGSLQPAAERLREALRERCSDAAFVPPTDKPAQIAGPGLTCTLAGSSCRLVRLAAPTRRDLVLTCTEPAASEALVQPRYTSAYTAGATFTTSECKTDRQFGLGGTVTADLWQPGSRPQDAVGMWRKVADRLRQQAADAVGRARDRAAAAAGAVGTAGAAGTAGSVFSARVRNGVSADGTAGGGAAGTATTASGSRTTPLQRLLRPHSVMARALRLALNKHRGRLTSAMAAWMRAHADGGTASLLQQSAPAAEDSGTSSAARQQGAVAVAQAVAALMTDLGLERPAGQLLSQLGVQEQDEPQVEDQGGRGAGGEGEGNGQVPRQGSGTAGAARMQQSAAGDGAGAAGGGDAVGGGGSGGGGLAGVFDLVGRTGLQALRAQLARAVAARGVGGAGADARGANGGGGGAGGSETASGEERGEDACVGDGCGGAVMRRVAVELARLAQM